MRLIKGIEGNKQNAHMSVKQVQCNVFLNELDVKGISLEFFNMMTDA